MQSSQEYANHHQNRVQSNFFAYNNKTERGEYSVPQNTVTDLRVSIMLWVSKVFIIISDKLVEALGARSYFISSQEDSIPNYMLTINSLLIQRICAFGVQINYASKFNPPRQVRQGVRFHGDHHRPAEPMPAPSRCAPQPTSQHERHSFQFASHAQLLDPWGGCVRSSEIV